MSTREPLRERARRAFAGLSPTHKRIVEYLLEFPHEAAFLSAAELGRRTNASDATVVRLAPALAYASFPELRADLQNSLIATAAPAALLKQRTTGRRTAEQTIALEIQNLILLQESLSDESVQRAADMIQKADRVFVLGMRGLFGVACSCHHLLRQIHRKVTLLSITGGSLPDDLAPMAAGDVLIAFSTPRYAHTIIDVGNFAQRRNCQLIAVTDSALAPIAQIASLVILISPHSGSFFPSSVAAQAFVNVLVTHLAGRLRKTAEKQLIELDGVLEALHSLAMQRSDD